MQDSVRNELSQDALAGIKADSLKVVKVVTCSPTSIVLTTQVRELKQAEMQTVFPTGTGPYDIRYAAS